MERFFLLALALATIPGPGAAATPGTAPAAASAGQASARCQVWARELSFAKTVADHDAAAFAAHLHPLAVFGVSGQPTRGREAITAQWQGIIHGSAVVLEWYPELVVEGGGGLVHSTGPALYRDPKSGGHRRSRFSSVWQRGAGGEWQVVFDDGTRPEPADAAAVAAFRAGRKVDCPAD